jgi:hypothetical protein
VWKIQSLTSNEVAQHAQLEAAITVSREIIAILEKMAVSKGVGRDHPIHSQLKRERDRIARFQAKLSKLDKKGKTAFLN